MGDAALFYSIMVDSARLDVVITRGSNTYGPYLHAEIEPLELLYIVTNEYDGTDELGFAWNDPLVRVDCPTVSTPDGLPIISDRDSNNPSVCGPG